MKKENEMVETKEEEKSPLLGLVTLLAGMPHIVIISLILGSSVAILIFLKKMLIGKKKGVLSFMQDVVESHGVVGMKSDETKSVKKNDDSHLSIDFINTKRINNRNIKEKLIREIREKAMKEDGKYRFRGKP